MTRDAIVLNRDTPRAAGLRDPAVSPDTSRQQEEHEHELGSKGKAWLKWGANLMGDTVLAAWSSKTFRTPKGGVDYRAKD
ncbi:uncharacterized protein BHQ10_007363 [Talaromyces amestolkiae]|uniref:Uncharacterized protein n=1 Tax=Talaromyces amestolkiae TaxID=1196081 RepID=A0A364L6M0_TALAM|nr:uncharacterized protein BHQ10_007363 [Talaromyces amestolkiae]RAO71351.1 hypothetical protein BHQ10_007363 [Talaromyces amestolkiae]